jgi:hypothetical protein
VLLHPGIDGRISLDSGGEPKELIHGRYTPRRHHNAEFESSQLKVPSS